MGQLLSQSPLVLMSYQIGSVDTEVTLDGKYTDNFACETANMIGDTAVCGINIGVSAY